MPQQIQTGKYFLLGFVVLCAIVLVDQYTKWLVMETILNTKPSATAGFIDWFTTQRKIEFFINERESFKTIVLAPFLNLVMVWNQGISFGMFDSNSEYMPLVFIASSLLISLLMLVWLALTPRKMVALALGLVVGGAIGNVIDRIRFGAVADFIDMHINDYHWPAYNVADACIVAGAAILMFLTLMNKESL